MSISATSTPGVCSRIRIPSFPLSAWRTSTSWLSRTLVSEKMLRMSSSTMSTLAPASSGTGRMAGTGASAALRLRRRGFWLSPCSRSCSRTRTRSSRPAGFSVTPRAPIPITALLRSMPLITWTGTWLMSGSCFSRSSSTNPSMSARPRSRVIAVGCSLRTMASVPAPAVDTTALSFASCAASIRIVAKVGSSSTISTNGSLPRSSRSSWTSNWVGSAVGTIAPLLS